MANTIENYNTARLALQNLLYTPVDTDLMFQYAKQAYRRLPRLLDRLEQLEKENRKLKKQAAAQEARIKNLLLDLQLKKVRDRGLVDEPKSGWDYNAVHHG